MSTNFFSAPSRGTRARSGSRVAVWALLIAALVLLTLAAGLRADAKELNAHASRTQNFVASGNLKSLNVENVNGSVEILAGPTFKADVNVTVYASTEEIARKRLDDVTVRFENENGELSLDTEEPGVTVRRHGRGWKVHSDEDHTWRTEVKYRITAPPGLALGVSTVNGAVSVLDVSSPMDLSTVNGKIDVTRARREAKLNTVNGAIRATFAELQKGVSVDVRTVNGGIELTLPAKAGFRFEGHTMSGEILSSFALPSAADDDEAARARDEAKAARDKVRAERDKLKAEIKEKKHKAKKSGEVDEGLVDLSELNEALADLNREMAEWSRELSRTMTIHVNRAYEGTVGDGGANVRCSNLNGRILLLAEGTTEAQAKKLTSGRGPLVVSVPAPPRAPRAPIPPVPPVPPVSPVAPIPPIPPVAADPWGRSIAKGDLAGDLVLSYAPSDVTAGHVGGRVKISTQSGQIHVKSAGKGAELSSAGGDIRIESVTGDLKATTSGGDIRAGAISGDARLETAGGDVVVHSAGGSVTARTGGGDITLRKVHGPVVARTSGGTIVCEISSTAAPGGELMTSGGDVTVTLPASYRADIDVRVTGAEMEADVISSQFPEIVVTRRPGSVSGEGKLNGGGPKLIIRSTSGSVSVRKGPAA